MQWQATPHWFIIAGAQRSGTTRLCSILDQHPQIELAKPFKPEPKVFLRSTAHPVVSSKSMARFFRKDGRPLVRGEKSTSYMEVPGTAERINSCLPMARIIFVLRNPVTRAISNYFYSCQNGLETRSLREVFLEKRPVPPLEFESSVSPFDYIRRSEYVEPLSRYIHVFGRDRVEVLIMEECVRDDSWLRSMFTFLGVDPTFEPTIPFERINSTAVAGGQDEEVCASLTAHFAPQIPALEMLLGKTLSIWRPSSPSKA